MPLPFRQQLKTGAPTLSVTGRKFMEALGRNWFDHLGDEGTEHIRLIKEEWQELGMPYHSAPPAVYQADLKPIMR